MNLVKWFRRNRTKVMAIVVIILMIGFIAGFSINNFRQSMRRSGSRTVATIAGKIKVTENDLIHADNELKLLKNLRADVLLSQMMQIPMLKTPDFQGYFLGDLLFTEQKNSAEIVNLIKNTIYRNLYDISEKQLNDMYRRSIPGNAIYWYCLKKEAQMCGIRVSNDDARDQLARMFQVLYPNRSYAQVISSTISQEVTEQQILETFGNLLAVLRYSNIVCSNEDITIRQLRQTVAWEAEGIDVEFVEFNPDSFMQTQPEPDENAITEQFNKYKKYFSGEVSDENPYAFGYKLPDMVQLEYIAVKLDEVSDIVKSPTQEEIDRYYDGYKSQLFTEQVPSDPNDPNSPLVGRVKPQSSVTSIISQQLKQSKINAKAEEIIREAVSITEEALQDFNDTEISDLAPEELAKLVGDYKTAAEQLGKKFEVKVHTGRTGMLDAFDMQVDELLSRLYLMGYGQSLVPLAKAVFAVEELAASELGPLEVQPPKMYANIGPVRDAMGLRGGTGELIAIVRVVKAEKAREPESIDEKFSTESIVLDPNDADADEDVYSVKEKVVEDLKKFAALNTAKIKADEFIKSVVSDPNWQNTIDKFNELYPKKVEEPNDPNSTDELEKAFKLENLTGMRMISQEKLNALDSQGAGNPASRYIANERRVSTMLVRQLYSLIPADSNSVEELPLVLEFKPAKSIYCIKSLRIRRLYKENYDKIKARQLYVADNIQYQSMAAVHFNPENILKRLKFELVETKDIPIVEEPEPVDISSEEIYE